MGSNVTKVMISGVKCNTRVEGRQKHHLNEGLESHTGH